MIRKIILASAMACLSVVTIQAQERCVVKGEIAGSDSLCYSPVKVTKVYLNLIDEYDRPICIDSAEVKDKKFQFTRELKADEPILLHVITGFDNGNINVFIEPGEISVQMPNTQYPVAAVVSGTYNNNLQREFNQIQGAIANFQFNEMQKLVAEKGDAYLDTEPGKELLMCNGGRAALISYVDMLRFFIKYSDSPFTPLMLKYYLAHVISPSVNQRSILKLVSPKLANHPYYRALSNTILAQNMRVGAQSPDISLPLVDGKHLDLSSLRGKFVFLDFWASWCAPCRREMPHLIQMFEDAKGKDNFALVSISLDDKGDAWRAAIDSFGIKREGWIHASDLLGWNSPLAQIMNVTAVPKTILLDPEGRIIAIDLRGEEMVRNMKRILAGDLYYQQGNSQEDGKTAITSLK